ncbi:hypothetical protein [Falsiroseomonas tokyonensis]|uniref:Uncharacterized protein n=1 Tax=Falsiroseomonas tokyonensis TaxID=430521 RepID=A0ABV7BMZ5_9PROT|nr:hypothetical protein [Falsiroseomonas tokyonensis]MBU8536964.1 hypothetical protein [Falsiroseomonas tokyonensis]
MPHSSPKRRRALGWLLAGTLAVLPLGSQVTQAQGVAPAAPRTMVTVPLQDLTDSGGIGERAEELWGRVLDFFGFSGGTGHFMRRHGALSRSRAQNDDFTWLMDISGYKLKEIESSIGLIPTFGLTFGQARELTEADRDYVERMLERHAQRNPGPLAVVQRTIVRGILDATEIGGFTVDKVDVDLFPLPRVKFVLSPTDAPLGLEASRILRAIDRLNARVQGMATQPQGMDGPAIAPPTQGLRPATLHN